MLTLEELKALSTEELEELKFRVLPTSRYYNEIQTEIDSRPGTFLDYDDEDEEDEYYDW